MKADAKNCFREFVYVEKHLSSQNEESETFLIKTDHHNSLVDKILSCDL